MILCFSPHIVSCTPYRTRLTRLVTQLLSLLCDPMTTSESLLNLESLACLSCQWVKMQRCLYKRCPLTRVKCSLQCVCRYTYTVDHRVK